MNNPQKNIKRVLVVDDEAVVRHGIKRVLKEKGIKTSLAANGKEALDLLEHKVFDIALIDIRMPDMSGIELLKKIKVNNQQPGIIMITGYPTIDTAVECIKLGALDYLVKPFRLDDLEAALQKVEIKNDSIESSGTKNNDLKYKTLKNLIIGESRPMKNANWEYCFFIDILGHRDDKTVQEAFAEIEKSCSFLKILGSYSRVQ